MSENLSEHTKHLLPLKVGDNVLVQNQYGPHPKKWSKTGVIIEVRQFDQYVLRIDGSGRVTLRNRKFLRKFNPVLSARSREIHDPIKQYTNQRPTANTITPSNSQKPLTAESHDPSNVQSDKLLNTKHSHDLPAPQLAPNLSLDSPASQSSPRSSLDLSVLPKTSLPLIDPPTISKSPKVPRALSQLRAYNTPGLKESSATMLTRTRSKNKD